MGDDGFGGNPRACDPRAVEAENASMRQSYEDGLHANIKALTRERDSALAERDAALARVETLEAEVARISKPIVRSEIAIAQREEARAELEGVKG